MLALLMTGERQQQLSLNNVLPVLLLPLLSCSPFHASVCIAAGA